MTHEPEWCEYGDCRDIDPERHEPECVSCHYLYGHKEIRSIECICDQLRAAYQRGYNEAVSDARKEISKAPRMANMFIAVNDALYAAECLKKVDNRTQHTV